MRGVNPLICVLSITYASLFHKIQNFYYLFYSNNVMTAFSLFAYIIITIKIALRRSLSCFNYYVVVFFIIIIIIMNQNHVVS